MMKLRSKILLGFGVIISILIAIEGYHLVFLNTTGSRINDIVKKNFIADKYHQESEVIVTQIHADIWDAILFGTERRQAQSRQIDARAVVFYDNIRKLEDIMPDEKESFIYLHQLFISYYQFGKTILDFENLEKFNANREVVEKFVENKIKIAAFLNTLVSKNKKEFETSLFELNKKFRIASVSMSVFTGLAVLFSAIYAFIISNTLTKPVNNLMRAMKSFETGNLDVEAEVLTKDEIGRLTNAFNKMCKEVRESLQRRDEQERLKNEMELARKIQTSLLPTLAENFHPDFQIAAAMLPAEQVGGDFYDVTYDRKGNLWFAIGDVSGHGVTPGLIMMMAQTVHTTVTTNIDCDARDVVVMINEILYKNVRERLNESHFMTFTALKYLGDGRFLHAGAHLSMIVFRQKTGECELIRTKGIYLNFKKDISNGTKNSEFVLDHGDILVLYTDGITEAESSDGKMLDIGGFVKIVKSHAHRDSEAMKDMIMADVIKWCDNKRADDMTIVIVRMKEVC